MEELPLVLSVYHFWMGFSPFFNIVIFRPFLGHFPISTDPRQKWLPTDRLTVYKFEENKLGAPETTQQRPSKQRSPYPFFLAQSNGKFCYLEKWVCVHGDPSGKRIFIYRCICENATHWPGWVCLANNRFGRTFGGALQGGMGIFQTR